MKLTQLPLLPRPRIYLLGQVYAASTPTVVSYRWPTDVRANDVGFIHSPHGSLWWHVASGTEGGNMVTVTRGTFWQFPSGWARVRDAREVDAGRGEYVAP